MLAMVDKYSADLPSHSGSRPLPPKDVVLVTGTTGALGATLLTKLVQTPEVEHIYALNRRSEEGKTLIDRQRERLIEWGLDTELLRCDKITFIESDMSESCLGLSESVYEQVSCHCFGQLPLLISTWSQIRTSVTHIIHNAYRVNFALALSSFDPNVRAARNFLNLALTSPYVSPAKLVFTSTIGVVHCECLWKNNNTISIRSYPYLQTTHILVSFSRPRLLLKAR